MSTVNSTYSSSSRVTGMFSGLDIDALVEKMCSGQQAKVDSQSQKKTTYEWRNDALTDVLGSVKDFTNTYLSNLGTSSMLKASTYVSYKVASTGSNSGAVTLTADTTAQAGSISVRVFQLASGASVSSAAKVSSSGSGISSSNTATLGSLSFANKLQFDGKGNISFSINGKAFTFSKDTTLQNMINTVNSDSDAGVTMTYSRLTDTFNLTSSTGGSDSKLSIFNLSGNAFGSDGAFGISTGTVSNGRNALAEINGVLVEKDSNQFTADGITYQLNAVTASSSGATVVRQLAAAATVTGTQGISSGTELAADNTATLEQLAFKNKLTFDNDGNLSFRINGTSFTFSKTTKLADMLAEINGSDAGVTMQYSRLKDAFTITSNSTGADSTVTVSNLTGNAFGSSGAFGIGTGILATGQNSIAVIDGVTVERDSNSYTIDGVSYNHTQITDLSNEQATFTVTRDFSSTVDAVKTFVDGLNTLLTKFTTLLGEKSYANSYKPLTDAQRDEMSEKEIEQWEEKAKSGLLRHNSALSGLVTSLKGVFYSPAGGTGSNASAIGIATGNYYDTNKGLLVVDTEALTKALSEDPDYVISMFTGGSSTAASSDQGLIYKLRSALTAYQKNTADTIEETEDKIDKTDESIDSLKKKLSALAEKYYQKFSVMETALAKLNSQASYISQLFS